MSRDILLAFVNSIALGNIEMVFETSLTVSGSMSTGEAVFEVEFFETRQGDDVINADFKSKLHFPTVFVASAPVLHVYTFFC